jgi:predicted transcriptional regulator
MNKLNDSIPPEIKHPFFQVPCCLVWQAIEAKFTGADWAIWQYIQMTDPFGEGRVNLDIEEIAKHLSLSTKQVHRSLNRLKEQGFYEWIPQKIRGRNLAPEYVKGFQSEDKIVHIEDKFVDKSVPDLDKFVPNLDKSVPELDKFVLNLDKSVPELDKFVQEHNIDRARVHTIQTNSDSHTLSYESGGEKILDQNSRFGFEIPEANEATQLTNEIVVKTNVPATRTDPFFNRRRDPKDISWDWLPDGPWRNENGKLDAEFWTAIANRWVKEHGGDIHEKKVNVLKHFRNEPTNLPIEWEWYQSVTIHKVANIQTRKMHGFDTEGEEQAMMKHTAALKSLPDVMRVTTTIAPDKLLTQVAPYAIPSIEKSQAIPAATTGIPLAPAIDVPQPEVAMDAAWDIVAAQTGVWEQKQIVPEGADNPEAYKSVEQVINPEVRDYWADIDQKRKKADVSNSAAITSTTSQPIKEQIMNLAERKSMPRPSAQDKKDQIRLSHWNNLLATGLPSVMADAERQALKAGYIIVDGQVVEPEF